MINIELQGTFKQNLMFRMLVNIHSQKLTLQFFLKQCIVNILGLEPRLKNDLQQYVNLSRHHEELQLLLATDIDIKGRLSLWNEQSL